MSTGVRAPSVEDISVLSVDEDSAGISADISLVRGPLDEAISSPLTEENCFRMSGREKEISLTVIRCRIPRRSRQSRQRNRKIGKWERFFLRIVLTSCCFHEFTYCIRGVTVQNRPNHLLMRL